MRARDLPGRLLRGAALLSALGIATWLVVRAQARATPGPEAAGTGGVAGEAPPPERGEPAYLPSSKSAIGIGGGAGGAFSSRGGAPGAQAEGREDATDTRQDPPPRTYLPSSKSLPFEEPEATGGSKAGGR